MKKYPLNYFAAFALTVIAVSGPSSSAAVKPSSLFTDNAVLQRGVQIPVWGTADPGQKITVALDGPSMTTTADSSGAWSVKLPSHTAGGPFTLTIASGSETVTLKNVLVGEVWLCGGQSNMFYPLNGFPNNPLTRAAIPLATDPLLHIAVVAPTIGDTPQTSVAVSWQTATPETVPTFSAVGYFFGRDLRKALGVPVGLIESCIGGTSAEAWVSREALQNVPSLSHYLSELDDYTAKYPAQLQKYNDAKAVNDAAMVKWKAEADAAKAAGSPPPPNRPRWIAPPLEPAKVFNVSTRLFNGMISPLIPYGIKGAIWYQGEANWNQGWDYKTLLPTLISDWRNRWGEGDFPFLYVQLPGFNAVVDTPGTSWFAEVREAQRLTLAASPNTGMVTINDLGDQKDIHPYRKEPVGRRLALAARAVAYGQKVEYSGPAFSKLDIEGAKAIVTFTHADGLHTEAIHDSADDGPVVAPADKVTGFAIAGTDLKYYAAEAVIQGVTVILTSPNVPTPVSVRYGWAQYPLANLVNSSGLWASPFRTDSATFISAPKQVH
ncbi:MAG TPA: sialate O-acetylesterase [Capsulimonadaceae bacterium]|jgi:sialate O-acetylesterase